MGLLQRIHFLEKLRLQRVSTLLTLVGQASKPDTAGKGGLIRGSPLFPSKESKRAVSSPQNPLTKYESN